MRNLATGVFTAMLVACSPDPCGNGPTHPVGLDISGASNSPCTLVVTDGHSSLTFDIPAPLPAIADTSLDARAAPTFCQAAPDAGVFADGTRTSTQLCFVGDATLDKLAHASGVGMCPLTLTLTCAGTTLYDRVTTSFCNEQC